jgi:hypothetical protein
MEIREVLVELYDRIPAHVREAVDGLAPEQLRLEPEDGSNPIGWLIWHLARVQDDHVADLLDTDQVWVTGDWARRCGLAADPTNTGFGHSLAEMRAVRPDSADVLIEYYEAVAARTRAFLELLHPGDLDRIVDERWDPPVSLGVRLVSVADDNIQHAGQAKYLRGVLARRSGA